MIKIVNNRTGILIPFNFKLPFETHSIKIMTNEKPTMPART
jgi:hypothetical protein